MQAGLALPEALLRNPEGDRISRVLCAHIGQPQLAPVRLDRGAEGAVDWATAGNRDRAMAEHEIALILRDTSSQERRGFQVRPGSSRSHVLVLRAGLGPNVIPYFSPGFSQSGRVFARAQKGDISIVVEHPELGPDPEQDREFRMQAGVDSRFELLRPTGG